MVSFNDFTHFQFAFSDEATTSYVNFPTVFVTLINQMHPINIVPLVCPVPNPVLIPHDLDRSEERAHIHVLTVFLPMVIPSKPERRLIDRDDSPVHLPLWIIFSLLFL